MERGPCSAPISPHTVLIQNGLGARPSPGWCRRASVCWDALDPAAAPCPWGRFIAGAVLPAPETEGLGPTADHSVLHPLPCPRRRGGHSWPVLGCQLMPVRAWTHPPRDGVETPKLMSHIGLLGAGSGAIPSLPGTAGGGSWGRDGTSGASLAQRGSRSVVLAWRIHYPPLITRCPVEAPKRNRVIVGDLSSGT